MKPWCIVFLATALAGGAAEVAAQPNPANMRSGVVSAAGSGNYTMFTVPNGWTFVLTDFTWTSYPFYPVTGLGTLVTVNDLSGQRWAWWAFDTSASENFADHENPVGAHWTTGLVFDANASVIVSVGPQAIPPNVNWIASWSGYLTAVASSALPDPADSKNDLGMKAAPNPSEDRVSVEFNIGRPGDVLLVIFDVEGHRIRTLLNRELPVGDYSVPWDGNDDEGRSVKDGVYFARLVTPQSTEVKKMTRLH